MLLYKILYAKKVTLSLVFFQCNVESLNLSKTLNQTWQILVSIISIQELFLPDNSRIVQTINVGAKISIFNCSVL